MSRFHLWPDGRRRINLIPKYGSQFVKHIRFTCTMNQMGYRRNQSFEYDGAFQGFSSSFLELISISEVHSSLALLSLTSPNLARWPGLFRDGFCRHASRWQIGQRYVHKKSIFDRLSKVSNTFFDGSRLRRVCDVLSAAHLLYA
jgi:hypothetical protein